MKELLQKGEETLRLWLEQNLYYIAMGILLLITLWIRLNLIPNCWFSGDYKMFLEPWMQAYRENGGLAALSMQIGDYYVPYNLLLAISSYLPFQTYTLVTFWSCLFEYISVIYIYKIIMELFEERELLGGKKKAALCAVLILLLPVAIFNSALWKQCDSIYTGFVLMSLYYLLKERYGKSIVLWSIAFCFKLQAVFFFPIFVIVYMVHKKISVFQFLYIPIVYVIGGLPAVILGRPWKEVYLIYYRQSEKYGAMTINFPNIYALGMGDYPALSRSAIGITLAILILGALYIYSHRQNLNKSNLVYTALWCAWTCVMFLPAMHERYNYLSLILLTVFYLAADIRKFWIAVVINMITLITYIQYLFGIMAVSLPTLALVQIAMYLYVSYDFYKKLMQPAEKEAVIY